MHVPHQEAPKYRKIGLPRIPLRLIVLPSIVFAVKSGAIVFSACGIWSEKKMIPNAPTAIKGIIHSNAFFCPSMLILKYT